MTRSFGKVDSFRLKGQGLAKDISSLKGMYPWHSGGFLAESPSRSFLLLSFMPPEYTQSFTTTLFFVERLLFRGNFRSLELSLFGPAAPSTYSSQGCGPSNYLFRASSAFDIFESGIWSLELSLSGQQRLRHIRVRALVPRIISFGPAAPSTYSRQDFGPSGYFSRASSTFETSEAGPRSVELLLSTQ
jgi:hypothetical protein